MKQFMTRAALGALTVGIAGGLAFLLAFILAALPQGTAQAEPGVSIGLDTNPYATSENTATSLSSIEGCIHVANNAEFDIDFYIKDVPETGGLLSFDATLSYDGDVLTVWDEDVMYFLNVDRDIDGDTIPDPSSVSDYSEGVPEARGYYATSAVDEGSNHDWGSGVLARLTLKAAETGSGVSLLNLMLVTLRDSDGEFIGPTNQYGYFIGPTTNAAIAVGAGAVCPDADNDGVFDPVDNCPYQSNPEQTDTDHDGLGDVCDNCRSIANADQADRDGDCPAPPYASNPSCGDVCDNCPLTANQDQADMDGDGGVDDDHDGLFNEDQIDYPDTMVDTDGDRRWDEDGGGGDACDWDIDGDGYSNKAENYYQSNPLAANKSPEVCNGIDNDGDGRFDEDPVDGVDNDIDGKVDEDPMDATGTDDDGDTLVNEGWDRNGNGVPDCMDPDADTDGDTIADPIDTDDDNDGDPDPGFNDSVPDYKENWMGTDPLDACPDSTTDPAWPPDFNNSGRVNILDALLFGPSMGSRFGMESKYNRRFDFNADKRINILDAIPLGNYMGKFCS
jgi:hypothetical protein